MAKLRISMKYVWVLVFLSISMISVHQTIPAFGCSCEFGYDLPEHFDNSVSVFSGKAIKVSKFFEDFGLKTLFEVEKSWKNVSHKTVEVKSENMTTCGVEFNLNESYLIYSNRPENDIFVGMCDWSAHMKSLQAKDHIPKLALMLVVSKDKIDNVSMPDWMEKNAWWLAEGKISDSDFVNGFQYLVKQGIIRV